jgi:aminopeptidase
MSSLQQAAKIALKNCMGLKPSEKTLIIYDFKKTKIANCFFNEGKKITSNVELLRIKEPRVNGEEPSKKVASEMLKHDVVMLVTSRSLSHTKARRNASKKGVRIASLPGIREETMKRAIDVDYNKMFARAAKIRDVLMKGKEARVLTSLGTDLTMKIKGRKIGGYNEGLMVGKGGWGNLPCGEIYVAPIEKSSNGVFFVDSCFGGVGKLEKPIKILVKNGYAVKIDGGKEAKQLKKVLERIHDKDAFNIAELGIGTNDKARLIGSVLEDEKVFGTAHIALGNSKSMGGKIDVPIHLDGIFSKPTIFVDNKKIMEKGKLLI